MQDESTIQNTSDPYDDIVKAASPSRKSANPYDDLIEKHAADNNIDPDLIRSVMGQESTNKPYAVSPKGARGLMQLMPATAARYGVNNIYDPNENIGAGARYLKFLSDKFNGDPDLTLAGYNAGEGAVTKHGNKIPPYKETQEYVPTVKSRYEKLTGRKLSSPYLNPADDPYASIVSAASKPITTQPSTTDPYDSIVSAAAAEPLTPRQQAQAAMAKVAPPPASNYLPNATRPNGNGIKPETQPAPMAGSYYGLEQPGVTERVKYPWTVNSAATGKPVSLTEEQARDAVVKAYRPNGEGLYQQSLSLAPDERAKFIQNAFNVSEVQGAQENFAVATRAAEEGRQRQLKQQAATQRAAAQAAISRSVAKSVEQDPVTGHWSFDDPRTKETVFMTTRPELNAEMARRGYGRVQVPTPKLGTPQALAEAAGKQADIAPGQFVQSPEDYGVARVAEATQQEQLRQGPGLAPVNERVREQLGITTPTITLPKLTDADLDQLHKIVPLSTMDRDNLKAGKPVSPSALDFHGIALLQPGAKALEPTLDTFRGQVKSERTAAAAKTGVITQEQIDQPGYFLPDVMEQDAQTRFKAWQQQKDERDRLLNTVTPGDKADYARILSNITTDPGWFRSLDIGQIQTASRLLNLVAGGLAAGGPSVTPYADDVRRKVLMAKMAIDTATRLAPLSQKEEAAAFVSSTLGDLSRIGLLTTLLGPIVGMGVDAAAQAKAENLPSAQVFARGVGGAATGAVFEIAPAFETAGPDATLRQKLFDFAKSSAAVGTGTYGVLKLSGASDEEATRSAVSNTLLHGLAKIAPEVGGRAAKATVKGIVRSNISPNVVRDTLTRFTDFKRATFVEDPSVPPIGTKFQPDQEVFGAPEPEGAPIPRTKEGLRKQAERLFTVSETQAAQELMDRSAQSIGDRATRAFTVYGDPETEGTGGAHVDLDTAKRYAERGRDTHPVFSVNPVDYEAVIRAVRPDLAAEMSRTPGQIPEQTTLGRAVNPAPTGYEEATAPERAQAERVRQETGESDEPISLPDVGTPVAEGKHGFSLRVGGNVEFFPDRASAEARRLEIIQSVRPETRPTDPKQSALNALDRAVKANATDNIRELSKLAAERGASMEEIKAIVSQPEPESATSKYPPGTEVKLFDGSTGVAQEMTDRMRSHLAADPDLRFGESADNFIPVKTKDGLYFYHVSDISEAPARRTDQSAPSASKPAVETPPVEAGPVAASTPSEGGVPQPPDVLYSGRRIKGDVAMGTGKNLHRQGVWLTSDEANADEYVAGEPEGRVVAFRPNFKKTAVVYDQNASQVDAADLIAQGYDSAWMAQTGHWVALTPESISEIKSPPLGSSARSVQGKEPQPTGVTFTTAKGSEYVVHEDGSTTRNKARRAEHIDSGPQPRSEATYYVTSEDAAKLGEIQAISKWDRRVTRITHNGKPRLAMMFGNGPQAGGAEGRTVVPFETEPREGLTPVEIWNGGLGAKNVHFGNEITEVRTADSSTQQPKPRESPTPPVASSPESVVSTPQEAPKTTEAPQAIIESAGYKYLGEQQRPKGKPPLQMFNDETGSTLTLEPDQVTPEGIKAKVEASRKSRGLPPLAEQARTESASEPLAPPAADRSETRSVVPAERVKTWADAKVGDVVEHGGQYVEVAGLPMKQGKAAKVAERGGNVVAVGDRFAVVKPTEYAPPAKVTTPMREYVKREPVKAEVSPKPFTWKTSSGQAMHAEAGDWKITHANGEVGSVKPDIFEKSYKPVEGKAGYFEKTGTTKAQKLEGPHTVQTLEGTGHGEAGDYLVTDTKGEQYIVPQKEFEGLYQPVAETKAVAGAKPSGSLNEMEPFPPEMDSLGIPRASMPQVDMGHRGALVNYLIGRGITTQREEIAPNKLKPTQAEFNPAKVEKARNWVESGAAERAILVSADDRVLDGHHSWMQKLEDAPDTPIAVIRLNKDAHTVLMEMSQFPSSYTDGTHHEAPPSAKPKVTAPISIQPSLGGWLRTMESIPKERAAELALMSPEQFREQPESRQVPSGSALELKLEELSTEALAGLPNKELDQVAMAFGVPRSGTKEKKIARLAGYGKVARELSESESALHEYTVARLDKLLLAADMSASYGDKELKINRLIQWRNKLRERVQLARVRHFTVLKWAMRNNLPVSKLAASSYKNDKDLLLEIPDDYLSVEGTDELRQHTPEAAQKRRAELETEGQTRREAEKEKTLSNLRGSIAIGLLKPDTESAKHYVKQFPELAEDLATAPRDPKDFDWEAAKPGDIVAHNETGQEFELVEGGISDSSEDAQETAKEIGGGARPMKQGYESRGVRHWAIIKPSGEGETAPEEEEPSTLKNNVQSVSDNSEVKIHLNDGSTLEGTLRRSAGMPWLERAGESPFTLAAGTPDLDRVKSIEVVRSGGEIDAEKRAKKFGEFAYPQPTTRQEYEDAIWGLADQAKRLRETDTSDLEFIEKAKRALQLEAQFEELADQIELAKSKRKYITVEASRRAAGESLRNPAEFTGGPLAAMELSVPKPTDFDPDAKVRRARSAKPAIAYDTKAEIEGSLRSAKAELSKKSVQATPKRRKQLERIIKERETALDKGQYREAIEEQEAQSVSSKRPEPRTEGTDEGITERGPQAPEEKQEPKRRTEMGGVSLPEERQPQTAEEIAEGLSLAEIKRRIPIGFDEDSVRIIDGRIMATQKPQYGGKQKWISLKKATSTPVTAEEAKRAETIRRDQKLISEEGQVGGRGPGVSGEDLHKEREAGKPVKPSKKPAQRQPEQAPVEAAPRQAKVTPQDWATQTLEAIHQKPVSTKALEKLFEKGEEYKNLYPAFKRRPGVARMLELLRIAIARSAPNIPAGYKLNKKGVLVKKRRKLIEDDNPLPRDIEPGYVTKVKRRRFLIVANDGDGKVWVIPEGSKTALRLRRAMDVGTITNFAFQEARGESEPVPVEGAFLYFRHRAPVPSVGEGQTLGEFVRDNGGMRYAFDRADRGELSRFTLREGVSGVINNTKTKGEWNAETPEMMAEKAAVEGYGLGNWAELDDTRGFEVDISGFLSALEDDLSNLKKSYSSQYQPDAFAQPEYEQYLQDQQELHDQDTIAELLEGEEYGQLYDKIRAGEATDDDVAAFRKAATDLHVSAAAIQAILDAPASTEDVPEFGEFEEDAGSVADEHREVEQTLPRELAGTKPRYSYGDKKLELEFASDIDRAAYITAQKTPSKRDADYLKWAMDATGLSESEVRQHGVDVRAAIKVQAKEAEDGDTVKVAAIYKPQAEPGGATVQAPAPPKDVYDEDYTGPRWQYGLINRPPGPGAVPKGRIIGADKSKDAYQDAGGKNPKVRHGTIEYPRALTEQEVYDYELVSLGRVDVQTPKAGDLIPVKFLGGLTSSYTLAVKGVHDGKVDIGYPDREYITKTLPLSSYRHFVDDLAGVVDVPADSQHPEINAVARGEAEFLGKGDDGLVFKVGDNTVKVSTGVPLIATNPFDRTPQEAIEDMREATKISETLRKDGVPGLLPTEFVEHGGKGFQIKPYVTIPDRMTADQIQSVRETLDAMEDRGYALHDEVQAGLLDGESYLFDTGKAGKVSARPEDDFEDDSRRFERWAEKMGGDPLPLKHYARDRFDGWVKGGAGVFLATEEGQRHGDKLRRALIASDEDPVEINKQFEEGIAASAKRLEDRATAKAAKKPAPEPSKVLSISLAKRLLALPNERRTSAFGPQYKSLRREIYFTLTGEKPTDKTTGATAIEKLLAEKLGINTNQSMAAIGDDIIAALEAIAGVRSGETAIKQQEAAKEDLRLTPDEPSPTIKLTVVDKADVIVGDEKAVKDVDLKLAVSRAQHQYTLWASRRNAFGAYPRWHYYSNLGSNREEANQRARAAADKIASGNLTGIGFEGKEQIHEGSIKTIGLLTNEYGPEKLMAPEEVEFGEQRVGFGSKYPDITVNNLVARALSGKDDDARSYVDWMVNNASRGRAQAVANHIRNRPEYAAERDQAFAEAREAVTPEIAQTLEAFGMSATPNAAGTLALGGKTFDYKDSIKQFPGSRFDGEAKQWNITPDGLRQLATHLGGLERPVGGLGTRLPAYVTSPELTRLRSELDASPDERGWDEGGEVGTGEAGGVEPSAQFARHTEGARPVIQTGTKKEDVWPTQETQDLLLRGLKFGIPRPMLEQQIEDVAFINRAYRLGKPLYLVASDPGAGKTYVSGAAIRELKRSGAKRIAWFTLRTELITQIKRDLAAYGIEDVAFHTYNELQKGLPPEQTDVVIFDEGQAVKNVAAGTLQAQAGARWMDHSHFPIVVSATPFENPVAMEYLSPTGIFDEIPNGFTGFAKLYGATTASRKLASGERIEFIYWRRGPTSDSDQKAARAWMDRKAIISSRRLMLPPDQVDSRMVKVHVDDAARKVMVALTDAAAEHEARLDDLKHAKFWIVNFSKRLLEAAKLQAAIQEADSAMHRGRWPVIFFETKAERVVDIPAILEGEAEWARDAAMAKRHKQPPPSRKEYGPPKFPGSKERGLPPMGVADVLETFMRNTGASTINIPPAEDLIQKHFGADNVAIFSGSVSPAKAQKNLDQWRVNPKPMVLAATMAKGGTGLSLQDTVGDHQTTQINMSLPWSATQVVQVTQRTARYGLRGLAEMVWFFADNIPFDKDLAARVGGRMADMGALVHGAELTGAHQLEDWDFDDRSFSELAAAMKEPSAQFARYSPPPQQLGFVQEGLTAQEAPRKPAGVTREELLKQQREDAETRRAGFFGESYKPLVNLQEPEVASDVRRLAREIQMRLQDQVRRARGAPAEEVVPREMPDVIRALQKLAELRRTHMTVIDYLGQMSLFGEKDTTPAQDDILKALDTNGQRYVDQLLPPPPAPEDTQSALFARATATNLIDTPGFAAWKGDAEFIPAGESLQELRSGEPVVVEAFHGTTHDYDVVDPTEANIESDFGRAFYASNTPEDVEHNYAGIGPDLTSRIERRAEQIIGERERDKPEPTYGTPEYNRRQRAATKLAKRELTQHQGMTMKVFVKMNNPLVLGGEGEPYWDVEYPQDEEGEFTDEEPTGKLVDFADALRQAAYQYDDGEIEDAISAVLEDFEGGKAGAVIDKVRKVENFSYFTDDNGDLASHEIIRDAIARMGYDGIIDNTVNQKFGWQSKQKPMAGMGEDTSHIIVWNPSQIKSAIGNRGTFDPNNPSVLFQRAIEYDYDHPGVKAPWQMTRAELSKDYNEELQIPNNARAAWVGKLPPEGSWRMDPNGGTLEQLQRVPLEDLTTAEDENDPSIQGHVAQYTEWTKAGKQAPPVTIVKHVKGHWVSINRRRVMAARRAGETTILAWVSDSSPTGRAIPTHEEVVRQALLDGKPVPDNVLADYPALASTAQFQRAKAISYTPPYTITALKDEKLQGRRGKDVKLETIKQILKQPGTKQIERDIINEALELPEFKGKMSFPYDDFEDAVRESLMPLRVINTTTYATYGENNVGVAVANASTHIYNSELEHGQAGHFKSDYEKTETPIEWEVKEVANPRNDKPVFFAVPKGVKLTEENVESMVGTATSTREQAEEWIAMRKLAGPTPNKGMFGWARAWTSRPATPRRTYFVDSIPVKDGPSKFEVRRTASDGAYTVVATYDTAEEGEREADRLKQNDVEKADALTGVYIAEIQSDPYQGHDATDLVLNSYKSRFNNGTLPESSPMYKPVRAFLDVAMAIRNANSDAYSDYTQATLQRAAEEKELAEYKALVPALEALREMPALQELNIATDSSHVDTEQIRKDNPEFAAAVDKLGGKYRGPLWAIVRDAINKARGVSARHGLEPVPVKPHIDVALVNRKEGIAHSEAMLEKYADTLKQPKIVEAGKKLRLRDSLEKQMIDALPIQDRQFIAHRKNWPTRILREEIRRAAGEGQRRLLIPTPRTLALIEGYISNPSDEYGDEEINMPYTIPGTTPQPGREIADLEVQDHIKIGDKDYIVIEADGEEIKVTEADNTYVYDVYDTVTGRAEEYAKEAEAALKPYEGKKYNINADDWGDTLDEINKELQDSAGMGGLELEEDNFDPDEDGAFVFRYSDVEGKIEEYAGETANQDTEFDWSDYDREYTKEIGNERYFVVNKGADTETFSQPEVYRERAEEAAKFAAETEGQLAAAETDPATWVRDNFTGREETVLNKYVELNDLFNKERQDVDRVKDDQGNFWLATRLTDEDAGPVAIFARGQQPSAGISKPEFTVEGNRISLNPAGAKLMSDAYRDYAGGLYQIGPAGVPGATESKPQNLIRFLGRLAKAEPNRAEDAQRLAGAVRQAAKAGIPVELSSSPQTKQHETIHVASHTGAAGAPVYARHTEEGYNELKARPEYATIRSTLLELGESDNDYVLIEESFAYIGSGNLLGLTVEQAREWSKAWAKSYVAKNGVESTKAFKETSLHAQQALETAADEARAGTESRSRDAALQSDADDERQRAGRVPAEATGEARVGEGAIDADQGTAEFGRRGTVSNLLARGREMPDQPTAGVGREAAGEAGVKQTDTPEFQQWFGDSKVVDENGPAVVYHGTADSIDHFDLAIGNVGTFDPNNPNILFGREAESPLRQIATSTDGMTWAELKDATDLDDKDVRSLVADWKNEGLIKIRPGAWFPDNKDRVERTLKLHDLFKEPESDAEQEMINLRARLRGQREGQSEVDLTKDGPLFARQSEDEASLDDVLRQLKEEAEDLQRPEDQKRRRLPLTLQAAQMETGTNLFYPPAKISGGIELAKQVIAEKGVDGAIEYVLHGNAGIEWGATVFEILARLRAEEARLRISGPAQADKVADKRLNFLNDAVYESTRNGQRSAGINAIEEYAPDRAAYILNRAALKGRGHGLSQQEEANINEIAEELAREKDRNRALDEQIAYRMEVARSLEEDLAAAERRARKREKYKPGEPREPGEKRERPARDYETKLGEQSSALKDALMAKIGNFNFGNLKVTVNFPSQQGAVGESVAALPGDAEMLAQYAAGLLSKFDTVAELNEHMLSTFGNELESVLSPIRQRALQIRRAARAAELTAKDTGEPRRRTILAEIQAEGTAARKAVRDLENAHVKAEKERKQAEEAAQREAQATAKKTQKAAETANQRQFRQEAREAASKARKEERVQRLARIKEARARAQEVKKEYSEASKAETKGWRGTIKEQREAARTAALWDTPIRNEATAARERLANATDPKNPDVMNDLVSVATAKFLRDKPGGTVGIKAIFPTQFYNEMAAEFPKLVNNKNRGEILKRAKQRIDDMTRAARDAARMRSASAEARKLWDTAGIDVETQALWIQKAEATRKAQEARRRLNQEAERVSRSWARRAIQPVIVVKNIARSLQTALNLHQGRQGMFALLTHPIAVTGRVGIPQSLRGMTAWKKESFYRAAEEQRSHRHAGLFMKATNNKGFAELPESHGDAALTIEEDQLQAPWAMKLPHVRLSTQAFILGMNAERLALFSIWATVGQANGYTWENNPRFFQQAAHAALDATGRSTIPRAMETYMGLANELFYATRLNYSRIMLINDLFNPFRYLPAKLNPFDPGFLGGGGRGGGPPNITAGEGAIPRPPEPPGRFSSYDPVMRRIMMGNLLRIAAAMAALLLTAKLLGFRFYTDPDDPDTWKLVWRNHHTDLSGGSATSLKFIYRFVRSIARYEQGEKLAPNERPLAILWRFYRTKAAPWPTAIIDWLEGKNVMGEPANFKVDVHHPTATMKDNIILRMLIPISIEETTRAMTEDGWIGGTPAMALQFLGFETQTYQRKQVNPPTPAQKLLHERSSFGGFDEEEPEDKDRRMLVRKLEDDIRAGKKVDAEITAAIKTGTLKPDDQKLIERNAQLTAWQLEFKRADVKDAMDAYEVASPEERAAVKAILIDKGPSIQKLRTTQQKDAYLQFKKLTGQAARMHAIKRAPGYYRVPSPSPTP